MLEPRPGAIPWTKVGFALTAGWMLAVVAITGSDVTHPLFGYIFNVPIVAWIAALLVARLVKAWRQRNPGN